MPLFHLCAQSPPVERLLQALGPFDVPRPVATAIVRRELTTLRAERKNRTGA